MIQKLKLLVFLLGVILSVPGITLAQTAKASLAQEDVGICNPLRFSSTRTGGTLSTAIASTGSALLPDCSATKILLIPPGGTWTISADLTVPARMTVRIPAGASITINATITLTLGSVPDCDVPSECILGTGTLTFSTPIPHTAVSSFISSGCTPTVPAPASLTFGAFACSGHIYVSGHWHVPVTQGTAAVTITNATTWLALHRSTVGTPSGCGGGNWTRVTGTYYLTCATANMPADPSGGHVFNRVGVSGGVISTVAPVFSTNPQGRTVINFTDPVIGGVCDGATDDTAAFTRAQNLLPRAGARFLLPSGNCITSSASPIMTILGSIGLTVEGTGPYELRNGIAVGTAIRQNSTGGGLLFNDDAAGNRTTSLTVKKLTLITSGTGDKAVDTVNCSQCEIDTINIDGWLGHAIDFRGVANLNNVVRNSRITGDRTSAGLTACRLLNYTAGNTLKVEYNYFNGAGSTNTAGCGASIEATGDVISIGNAFDRTPVAILTRGAFTSVHDWFDYTSAANLQVIVAYRQLVNNVLAIFNPIGPLCDNTAQIDFQSTDRRYLTCIGTTSGERGVFGGVETWSLLNPPAFTGDVNDYTPTLWADTTIIRLNPNGANRTITGFGAGRSGQVKVLINTGTEAFIISHDSASSVAANRVRVSNYAFDYMLVQGGVMVMVYDGTQSRWRVVNNFAPQRLAFAPTINFGAPGAVPGCNHVVVPATDAALGDRANLAPTVVTAVTNNHHFHAKVLVAGQVLVSVCQYEGAATDPDGAGQVYRLDVWKN